MGSVVRNSAYFVKAIRQLANVETDPIVTDPEVLDRANEALSALYDILVGTYEHYQICTYPFTLAGGVGANSTPLPDCFYKDVSLDLNPTTTPSTVHRYTSLLERNNLARRSYLIEGSNIVVSPPQLATGNYLLSFTPLPPILSPSIVIDVSGGINAVDGTLRSWSFAGAAFLATDVGSTLVVSGATNAGNNGSFVITSVSDATDVVTGAATTLSDESLPVTASVAYATTGTIDFLPQIFVPWYEYIQVAAAIAVKDKIEQDTSDLEIRLARLTARITAAASNRMEEGGQIGLTRDHGGFWDLTNNPGGV